MTISHKFQKHLVKEIQNHLGGEIDLIGDPPQGMDSRVFFIEQFRNGTKREYAVKVAKDLTGEISVIKLLTKNNVEIPFPQIIKEFKKSALHVVVYEKMKGLLFDEIGRSEMQKYIPEMLKALKRLHKIKSLKVLDFQNGQEYGDWKSYLLEKFNGKGGLIGSVSLKEMD
jgi:hypothetical protein